MSDQLLLAHSPEVRKAAVAAFKKHGSIRKAAAEVGIPKSTLHDIVSRETAQSGPISVEDMPDRLIPAAAEDTQSDEMAREEQERSEKGEDAEQNPEPLPKGTPPIPQDISPMDLEGLEDPQERATPSHRFDLEAVYRYVNLLANGVHPTYAQQAAKQIDPEFSASPEETGRWQTALERAGYNPRAMPLSEKMVWLFAEPGPPAYVRDIYDSWAMGSSDTASLADMIQGIREDAYLSGINEQLTTLNRDNLNVITDPDVLASMRQQAETAAGQITATYNRELASQVGSAWLDAAGNPLPPAGDYGAVAGGWAGAAGQIRQQDIQDAVDRWAADRADWKAESIAITEAADAYSNGVLDFATQNGGATVSVQPDECKCDGCQELVDMGPIPIEDAADIDLPLHIGCDHSLVAEYNPMDVPGDLWLPVAA